MVPLLPTKTLRRCCQLLWRPPKKDRHTKKNKINSLLLSLCWLHCPPFEKVRLAYRKHRSKPVHSCHKMEHLQTEPAGWNISMWNGGERKVIGPPKSLCRSLERQLAVASYVSIARFPTRWRYFFFFFLNTVFRVRKRWWKKKNTASSRESWTIIFILMSYIVFSHNGGR